jgi:hypothetical protein
MWKNVVQPDRPQMIIWRMRTASWIPEATNTQSEYVTLFSFPLQQLLHERAPFLRSTSLTVLWLQDLLVEAILRGMFSVSTQPFQAVPPNLTIQLGQDMSQTMAHQIYYTLTTSGRTVSMLGLK